MTLFDWRERQLAAKEAPLAARMRPRSLDEFHGQEAIVGPGRLLRRAIQADQLGSLIFYGPPGTGKTTLARIIANTTRGHFVSINAVLAGVKDIRAAIDEARDARAQHGRRTILFVDEVHRFNKAQQDALLPWVESGTVTLIGATTENPYFEVNKALVSRSRIFRLEPLDADGLRAVALAALADRERGFGDRRVRLADEALEHLVNIANGDARAMLNALELAVETTPPDEDGEIHIDLTVAEESIQRRAVLYDKEGDAHFDTISAFIKSCRGSDPDAALYWLARMVYAGEDPRFILRRLLILAGEDVGLADPDTLGRVVACADAFDRVGMPEGRYHLAQATLVVATAPKSNSTMGFFDALKAVSAQREGEVPNPLKDSSRDAEGFGHGEGYLYPHAYRDHWVAQQYLPRTLQGQVFYQPSEVGHEAKIRIEVQRRREAQIAALEDELDPGPTGLSSGPTDRAAERWLARAAADAGRQLARARDGLLDAAALERHHLVLDLAAGSGLLTWELVRRCPEGGVVARVEPGDGRVADRTAALPELSRPQLVEAPLSTLSLALEPGIRFDRVVGWAALGRATDRPALFASLLDRLRPEARLCLAEPVPRRGQRLSALLPPEDLDPGLAADWRAAEEALFHDPDDPATAWDGEDLVAELAAAGLSARLEYVVEARTLDVDAALIERWWGGTPGRVSYRARLEARLPADRVEAIAAWSRRRWFRRRLRWQSTIARLVASRAPG